MKGRIKLMKKIVNMVVFCGASSGNSSEYLELARELGNEMAKRNIGLVYGSGARGLMGEISKTARENGSFVTGITTPLVILKEDGLMSPYNNHVEIKGSIHDRKRLLTDLADVVVSLPGGTGSLDEILDVLERQVIKEVYKPMIIINYKGFWDGLKLLLQNLKDKGFAGDDMDKWLVFVDDVPELFKVLKERFDFDV